MAHEDAIAYITRLLPVMREKYLLVDSDEDLCQQALLDMLKKWDTLGITNDDQFTIVFKSFYSTLKWVERSRYARGVSRGTYWHAHAGGIPSFLEYRTTRLLADDPFAYNPWVHPRLEALEFIELLPTPVLRKAFYLYYIEGYTLEETATLMHRDRGTVSSILSKGLALLQAAQAVLNAEGRSQSEGPTRHG